MGFFGGSKMAKNLSASEGDVVSIPESGRSSGKGNDYTLQYSCLWNPMGRGAWWATVHGVTSSQKWLSNWAWMHTGDIYRRFMCVCVCVCMCIYMCVYVCMCIYVCVCMHVYIYVCVCMCIHTCVYACVYVCMCIYVCMHPYVCVCVCMIVYVCVFIYIYIYICACIYTSFISENSSI